MQQLKYITLLPRSYYNPPREYDLQAESCKYIRYCGTLSKALVFCALQLDLICKICQEWGEKTYLLENISTWEPSKHWYILLKPKGSPDTLTNILSSDTYLCTMSWHTFGMYGMYVVQMMYWLAYSQSLTSASDTISCFHHPHKQENPNAKSPWFVQ